MGKIKRSFLAVMYGEEALAQMARLKLAFDPAAQLGRGNLIDVKMIETSLSGINHSGEEGVA